MSSVTKFNHMTGNYAITSTGLTQLSKDDVCFLFLNMEKFVSLTTHMITQPALEGQ